MLTPLMHQYIICFAGMRGSNLRLSERMAALSGWDPETRDLHFYLIQRFLIYLSFIPFFLLLSLTQDLRYFVKFFSHFWMDFFFLHNGP